MALESRILLSGAAPTAPDQSIPTRHDMPVGIDLSWACSDPEGDPLTFSLGTAPQHGSVSVSSNGYFDYMPDVGYAGADSFTYLVSDGTSTTEGTVHIHVMNFAPVAVDDPGFYALHDQGIYGDVASNDHDADSDPMTYALASDVSHGTLEFQPNGTFWYMPEAGYVGTDTFTYTVTDGIAPPVTATVLLYLHNSPPMFQTSNPVFYVTPDLLPGAPVGSLTAVDPEYLDRVSYEIIGGEGSELFEIAPGGTLHVASNVGQRFDPASTPEYLLTVEARDQLGASSEVQVRVVVQPAAARPTMVVYINIDDAAIESSLPSSGTVTSDNPFGLTQDDFNRLRNDRSAWQTVAGAPEFDDEASTHAAFSAALSWAEQRLAAVEAAVITLNSMRDSPASFTREQYYAELREAVFKYDRYTSAYREVQTVKAAYLNSLSLAGWVLGPDQGLLERAAALPLHIDGLDARMTPDQFTAVAGTASQITQILANTEADLGFTQGAMEGARNTAGVGAVCIGAFALAPGAAVGLGVMGLVAGYGTSASTRISDGQSLEEVIIGSTADVTGFTSIAVGLNGIDPVTGNTVSLTPENQGYLLGQGMTQLVVSVTTLGVGGGTQQVTLTVPSRTSWNPLPNQWLAGTQPALVAEWPTTVVASLPGVNVSATTVTIGGQTIVLMAGRRPAAPDSSNYRGRFNAERRSQGRPTLPDDWDAHHVIPQRYIGHPEFQDFDFHQPSNIRGIRGAFSTPNDHQVITSEWNRFADDHPHATRAEIEAFAAYVDSTYSHFWWP